MENFFYTKRCGVVLATGRDRVDFFNRMSTADMKDLKTGEWIRTIFTSDKGRIVDVVNIIEKEDSSLLLTTEHFEEILITHLEKYIIMDDTALTKSHNDLHIIIISSDDSTVSGKLKEYFGSLPDGKKYVTKDSHTFMLKDEFKYSKYIIYTTELNVSVIRNLFPELKKFNDEEYELFRIKNGLPEGKNEFNELINPKELNFEELISYTKGCYIGQEVIARLDSQGKIPKKLVKISSDELISVNDKVFLSELQKDLPPHRQGMAEKEVGFISSAAVEGEKTYALGIIRAASLFADKKYYVSKDNKKINISLDLIF
ncbi:folate-binding protein YgfZ [soil metagenome]